MISNDDLNFGQKHNMTSLLESPCLIIQITQTRHPKKCWEWTEIGPSTRPVFRQGDAGNNNSYIKYGTLIYQFPLILTALLHIA